MASSWNGFWPGTTRRRPRPRSRRWSIATGRWCLASAGELSDPHDAHDAFQATFLVLVSKAGSIRHREAVGGWLFGIARRVAARRRPRPPGAAVSFETLVRDRAHLVGRRVGNGSARCRARLSPTARRGRPAARAVPRAGRACTTSRA